jgi:UDP-N-acetyl-D-galactosamine dehydrogenase
MLTTSDDISLKKAKVGILGLTFKENVPDLRNSKIPDILAELKQYGIEAIVHDPLGDAHEAFEEYKIKLAPLDQFANLDVMILAVAHKEYLSKPQDLLNRVKPGGILIDVKSALSPASIPPGLRYWSL